MQITLPEDPTEQQAIDAALDIVNATEEMEDLDTDYFVTIKETTLAYFKAAVKAYKTGSLPRISLPFLVLGYRDAMITLVKTANKHRNDDDNK